MKATQCEDDEKSGDGDDRVVNPTIFQVEAEPIGARHATQTVFAAGERGPAESDRIRQRSERKRQQRKINAAAAQHQKRNRAAEHGPQTVERNVD